MAKHLPANARDAGDLGSIPGLGRSLGGRNDNQLQYSCLESPMDQGAWWATGHMVAKSQTHRARRGSESPSVQSHLPCFLRFVFVAGEVKWFVLGQPPGPRETPVRKNSIPDP